MGHRVTLCGTVTWVWHQELSTSVDTKMTAKGTVGAPTCSLLGPVFTWGTIFAQWASSTACQGPSMTHFMSEFIISSFFLICFSIFSLQFIFLFLFTSQFLISETGTQPVMAHTLSLNLQFIFLLSFSSQIWVSRTVQQPVKAPAWPNLCLN
jgi:hypothetical protein